VETPDRPGPLAAVGKSAAISLPVPTTEDVTGNSIVAQQEDREMEDELARLQEMIEEDMRRTFSETVIDHAMNPRNVGRLKDADGWGRYTGPCGDTMEIWIKVSGDEIEETGFFTDGCGTSIASGSMVCELAYGKRLEEALEVGQDDVLHALDGLPEESEHCALLAATTLKLAIGDHLGRLREPWKKDYERR